MRIPIVIFAQIPPPEHGQSRMVSLALETLRQNPDKFQVFHVNAKFSNTLEEIGEGSLGKVFLTFKYLTQAICARFRTQQPILYYIPGPVKWSAVLRDWVLLAILRMFYSRVVFHWHAIGQGEWSHGSTRRSMKGPSWLDEAARRISAWVLEKPFASITVTSNSRKDAIAVASKREWIICNGIEDPCPGFDMDLAPLREARQQELAATETPCFRILFISHGTLEKGITDAIECLGEVMERCPPTWRFQVTFAGGVSDSIRIEFDTMVDSLLSKWHGRIEINKRSYLTGIDKHLCFIAHDIFLAPSRWESFGLTVIEAMAYGMPIVAAASDGVKGVLPDDYPYLPPVKDSPALAGSLQDCCEALRSQPNSAIGNALRERFLSYYQIKDFSGNLVKAFLELNEGLDVQYADDSVAPTSSSKIQNSKSKIHLSAYLADQNPGYDRSFGISRMSQVILEVLQASNELEIQVISSKTSQQAPASVTNSHVLAWGTRRKWMRLATDHLHPLLPYHDFTPELHYFPKGYLPFFSHHCSPSVVTIHDTIIQYDADHYPKWRSRWEYGYWAIMLKHTLRHADRILTVSESSKRQILEFMERHSIPRNEITVTYEPCAYEQLPQPVNPTKSNYVIHLASLEPHKRTAQLIRWWHEADTQGRDLPMLHLIGQVPPEVSHLLSSSHYIVTRPFLEEAELHATYRETLALILPSEIEGFGLPALEAYYLGSPVCYVKGTSVEEILQPATNKGGFSLDSADSLFAALDDVMAMSPEQVRECGLKLRDTYASDKVSTRMIEVFREVTE